MDLDARANTDVPRNFVGEMRGFPESRRSADLFFLDVLPRHQTGTANGTRPQESRKNSW
jgi:hypothetical protein